MQPRTLRIGVAIGFALVATVLFAIQFWTGGPSGSTSIGGPFTLMDQNGRERRDRDFRGQMMLVYFGYTYCPDVCPTELVKMGAALDELGKDGEGVTPVFITVDPARDTPERMREYASNFHPRLVALTGDAEAVTRAAKAYRVYFARSKDSGEGDDYLMDHTSIIYLMGTDGQYLEHFTQGIDASRMAARIRPHLR